MTERTTPSPDRYAHLREQAACQKQTTVRRLQQAIAALEDAHRPVSVPTIKEISGLDYMTYYRNKEAFSLFRRHSTHLQKEQSTHHCERSQNRNSSQSKDARLVTPRDPLANIKEPNAMNDLQTAITQRDQAERLYRALLQEHMECGLTIARLEAKVAKHLDFMEQFRISLQKGEHTIDS